MISVYQRIESQPEGTGVAVFTHWVSGGAVRLGHFDTEAEAQRFIARRTKGAVYCPVHDWMFINPTNPSECPGPARVGQPAERERHLVTD